MTNLGQITIPASMRRAISLDQYNKALVKIENKMIMIEPNVDLFDIYLYYFSLSKEAEVLLLPPLNTHAIHY